MTEYTPSTEEVRAIYLAGKSGGTDFQNSREFENWLRKVKEDAWDDGNQSGEYDAYYEIATVDKYRNPYREDAS